MKRDNLRRVVYGLAILMVGGCVAAEDEGIVASEVLGGALTASRVEIGLLASCTGTLVGGRYVVTAGTCVANKTTPAGTFGVLVNNLQRAAAIQRVHLYGWNSATVPPLPVQLQQTGDGVGNNDVALLQLSSPLTASDVTAATVAAMPPTGGSLTMFGWGCTSQQQSPGQKSKLTYTFGQEPQMFCGLDHGGPSFEGFGAQTDALWGVASAIVNGHDQFGNVSYYKEALLAVIRSWEGSPVLEVGFARGGNELRNVATASAAACQTTCEQDAACRAFTFTTDGRCSLQKSVNEWGPCPTCTAGIPRRLEPDTDRNGHVFATVAATSAESCLQICGKNPVCNSYTFDAAHQTCAERLFNATETFVASAGKTSGVSRALEADIERVGHTYQTLTSTPSPPGNGLIDTAKQCAQLCAVDGRCRAFTFWPSGTRSDTILGLCELKNATPFGIPFPRLSSGVRRGLEYNVDRPGSDLQALDQDPPSAEYCQAACAANPACKAFTFVPPGIQGFSARCYLKSAIPGAVSNAATEGLVSGIAGAEFF
jgi:hypothetical protein